MDECNFWQGFKSRDGYGIVHRGGKLLKAHRIAYCEAHGLKLQDIAGKVVRHKCDNRACVNPNHLELGTTQDNTKDRHERGRNAAGSKNGMAKLTEEQVISIRNEFKPWSRQHGAVALAGRYGVHHDLIRQIVHRHIWTHV